MILATWLSQAAVEEQTSVLNIILKVYIHPLILDLWPIISTFSATNCCSNGCRYYAIFRYTKHFPYICRLYCRVLIDCDFIGLQVCCHAPYFISVHLFATKYIKKFKLLISMAYTYLVAWLETSHY